MSPNKKVKNTADGSTITAGGQVSIGDRTTINQVFNMDATQGDLDFFTKFYMVLIAIFAVAMLVLLFYPWPKDSMIDYLGSFAAGGFFALGSLILVFFLRSKQKSTIPKIMSDEI